MPVLTDDKRSALPWACQIRRVQGRVTPRVIQKLKVCGLYKQKHSLRWFSVMLLETQHLSPTRWLTGSSQHNALLVKVLAHQA